ncbi:MAG: hypothetical protein ACT4NY_30165 [Pseudonocardiales bacterium]
MTADSLSVDLLDDEALDRLHGEVQQAMALAKEHGFHVWRELCDPPGGERFALGRCRPGECVELIVFRGLQAQAVRANEITLLMIDPIDTDAGTSVWTGWALDVVTKVLGLEEIDDHDHGGREGSVPGGAGPVRSADTAGRSG